MKLRSRGILAEGDDARAEVRAREVLGRWPDSIVARRALAGIEERRRRRTAEDERLAASAALDRGDLARAAELARRAGALGADVGELVARIEAAEAVAHAADEEARVEHVCALLAGDEGRGLAAYLLLEPALRSRVVARVGDDSALPWLDELGDVERARQAAAVAAVLALRRARAAAGDGEHARVLDLLAEHPVLEQVREARVMRARAREVVAARQQQAAASRLEEVAAALAHDERQDARQLLDGLARRALSPEQRSEAERLGAAVQQGLELEARRRRIDACVAAGDPLGARRELEAARADPLEDAAAVRARLDAVCVALREGWHVRSTTRTTLPPGWLGELVGRIPWHRGPDVGASGDTVVLAVAHERHVFVAAIDLAVGRATVHHVETPSPLGPDVTCALDEDRLWLGGEHHVLQLDWRTGDVVRWESLAPFVEGSVLENLYFAPTARSMWIETTDRGDRSWDLKVIDLDRWSAVRSVHAGRYLMFLPGEEPLFGALDLHGGAVLHTGRGSTAGTIPDLRAARISAIARHPVRSGFVVLAAPPDEDVDVSLYEIVPRQPISSVVIPDSDPDAVSGLVSTRDTGLVFGHTGARDGAELFAFREGAHGMEPAFRVAAPAEVMFVVDSASRRGFVCWEGRHDICVAELGELPPSFGEIIGRERFSVVAPHFSCAPVEATLFTNVHERFRAGCFDEVVRELESVDVHGMPAAHREHLQHLLGLAYARLGDAPMARAVWERGLAYAEDRVFPCDLATCIELVEELPASRPEPAAETYVTTLRRAIAAAARCRANGDERGALAALRIRIVYRGRERQSLARLADAWLATSEDPDDAAAWFDKAQALAQFLAVADAIERDLPIPDAWDPRRISEVAVRARAWFAAT
ncbi:MAG: hypothetical protein KIT31_05490 [Deltaproteobacteria bacterium]|nr:hypothetical protein [Deltaproteobacteria bacterium]